MGTAENVDDIFARWEASLRLPGVTGLVIGRSLLFPADGRVDRAVKRLVEML